MSQLDAFNAQAPVCHHAKLVPRISFEYVVRKLIDDMGGLADDGRFNAAWMSFCNENLLAEKRVALAIQEDAYEQGRADALRSHAMGATTLPTGLPSFGARYNPARRNTPVVHTLMGNGRDVAESVTDVEMTREAMLSGGQPAQTADPDRDRTTRDFYVEYLEDHSTRKGDDRAATELGPIVEFMLALIGDKRPRDYTRADFKTLNKAIPKIPIRKGIPKKHCASLHARYLYRQNNPGLLLELVTETTIVRNYHSGLNRFFAWMKEMGLIDKGPVLNLVTPQNRSSLPRDSFDDVEVLELVKLPLFTGCRSQQRCWSEGKVLVQGALYWSYLILLLTGMRTGEVGSLRLDDIGEVDGIAYFDLRAFDARKGRVMLSEMRPLKTKNAARIVPIHPLLIELGLLEHRDYMRKSEIERLLPDCEPYKRRDGRLRWSQDITKSWQYLKTKYALFKRKNLTLYSSRHLMAQWIDELNISARTRGRLLGHSTLPDAAANYGRKGLLSLEELKILTGISNPLIDEMRDILLPPKRRADAGELTLLRPIRPAAKVTRRPRSV